MSEHQFFLVPTDPHFTATKAQVEACKQRWKDLSPQSDVYFVFNHPHPMIWNFSEIQSVRCGGCAQLLQVAYDFGTFQSGAFAGWWSELTETMQFGKLDAELAMPCCKHLVSREALYSWCEPNPAFSTFVCGAHEPDIDLFEPDRGLMKGQWLRDFESLLGVPLGQVWIGA